MGGKTTPNYELINKMLNKPDMFELGKNFHMLELDRRDHVLPLFFFILKLFSHSENKYCSYLIHQTQSK